MCASACACMFILLTHKSLLFISLCLPFTIFAGIAVFRWLCYDNFFRSFPSLGYYFPASITCLYAPSVCVCGVMFCLACNQHESFE